MKSERTRTRWVASALFLSLSLNQQSNQVDAFASTSIASPLVPSGLSAPDAPFSSTQLHARANGNNAFQKTSKLVATCITSAAISAACLLGGMAHAEDELAAKYGNRGFDSSLVDQTCLTQTCGVQAKACLADDPSCRKGLTCTAKCLGDNACITGCMARYGNKNLDNLLKCTIEDNECIKVAILDGGADKRGEEPRAPAPTIRRFNVASMEGSWYKVVGFNPNYDCYQCQKNTFAAGGSPVSSSSSFPSQLQMDVEFSMPHLLPDGSPEAPKGGKETLQDGLVGAQSVALNRYETHETMIFDDPRTPFDSLSNVLKKGGASQQEVSYARTAHSEGEMFGLKFWENWYILGENEPGTPEFKFVYYNGKTRQNTYEGAFVYSRSKELPQASMKQVYQIAQQAGMNPDQFCKIRNGACFGDDSEIMSPMNNLGPNGGVSSPTENTNSAMRGILASTKVSQLLGVEPVAAEVSPRSNTVVSQDLLTPQQATQQLKESKRAWWYEVGDYLENPRRHFALMDQLRTTMDWPEEIVKELN